MPPSAPCAICSSTTLIVPSQIVYLCRLWLQWTCLPPQRPSQRLLVLTSTPLQRARKWPWTLWIPLRMRRRRQQLKPQRKQLLSLWNNLWTQVLPMKWAVLLILVELRLLLKPRRLPKWSVSIDERMISLVIWIWNQRIELLRFLMRIDWNQLLVWLLLRVLVLYRTLYVFFLSMIMK